MNISIVTYYAESGNYGAFYQAFALNEYLKGLGNDVSFWGDKSLEEKEYLSEYMSQKANGIRCLRNEFFKVDYDHDRVYDLTFVGSDQVWGGKEERFWGIGLKSNILATYAPSVGNLVTSKVKWKAILKGITGRISFYRHKDELFKFDAISVRDKQTEALIRLTLNKQPISVLDPTFLIDWSEHMNKTTMILEEPYLLVYSYGFSKEEEDNIIGYANKHGLKTCVVNYDSNRFDYSGAYTPFQVLHLFKNAQIVFTDTFHGTAFSLIFNREMYVLGRNKALKPYMLLSQFDLTDHCVHSFSNRELRYIQKVNYTECNIKIAKLKEYSKKYIEKCIAMAGEGAFKE